MFSDDRDTSKAVYTVQLLLLPVAIQQTSDDIVKWLSLPSPCASMATIDCERIEEKCLRKKTHVQHPMWRKCLAVVPHHYGSLMRCKIEKENKKLMSLTNSTNEIEVRQRWIEYTFSYSIARIFILSTIYKIIDFVCSFI